VDQNEIVRVVDLDHHVEIIHDLVHEVDHDQDDDQQVDQDHDHVVVVEVQDRIEVQDQNQGQDRDHELENENWPIQIIFQKIMIIITNQMDTRKKTKLN
jgi:hypothetical protein